MSLQRRIEELAASVQQESDSVYLVDADRLPYLAALLADQADLDPNRCGPAMRHVHGKFERDLVKQFEIADTSKIIYFLSRPNFREQVSDDYKANRKTVWQPAQRPFYKEAFIDLVDPWLYDGYEADDLLGICGTHVPHCVIVSNDKDLNQIPGRHYDPQKRKEFTVTPKEARFFKYQQWIQGDTTDGYSGIRNMGPKRAAKFLEGIELDTLTDTQACQAIRDLYAQKGQARDCESVRKLAWILTDVLGAPAIQQ